MSSLVLARLRKPLCYQAVERAFARYAVRGKFGGAHPQRWPSALEKCGGPLWVACRRSPPGSGRRFWGVRHYRLDRQQPTDPDEIAGTLRLGCRQQAAGARQTRRTWVLPEAAQSIIKVEPGHKLGGPFSHAYLWRMLCHR